MSPTATFGKAWRATYLVQIEAPALADRISYDPEAGMFCAYGDSRDALEALAALMQPFTTDAAPTVTAETPASGAPQNGNPTTDGFGNLQQGYLEQANVEAVSEISDLIAAQRAYEMNAKVITAADQMLSATSNLMR